MKKDYTIAVAGTGYVGLSIATLLSQHHKVMAVDIVKEKVDLINNRKSPIQDDYSLANNDARITVVHKKNAGLGMARNTGLEYATGKYVAFIDSDDYTDVNMIQKLHNALEEYNSDTSYCGYTMAYDSGELVSVPAYSLIGHCFFAYYGV